MTDCMSRIKEGTAKHTASTWNVHTKVRHSAKGRFIQITDQRTVITISKKHYDVIRQAILESG